MGALLGAFFVVRFDLSDRESATKAYCELIKSIYIRRKRRPALKTSFDHFRTHYEDRFWTKRALEVRTELVANRSGLIVHEVGEVQSKVAFNKFVRAHSDLENEPPDEEEESPKLKKARSVCEVTGWSTAGEMKSKIRIANIGTMTKRVSDKGLWKKKEPDCRRTLTSETETGTSKRHHTRPAVLHLDVNGLIRIPYEVDGVDVRDGSVDSIRDRSDDVPDIPAATIQHVKNHLMQDIFEFGDDKSLLLCALEQELARGSLCHHQYSDQTDALLCHIFQVL
ncbi:hypothetical protein KI688_007534 [Linnemannia hyalina]|uniref:Uncharacterized protein n=1 Tax=Linnemannia hyalina TaxID=64524 RepID=A0A9P8BMW9_9FUNG|nr:hypothetical protein KI688_007534 [Linnemannia hyalina]